jgi:hypothetical protein
MRADVQRDFDWYRQCIPQMKAIVGQHLAVSEAPYEEDARRNTDLIVLAVDAATTIRVACRVRGYEKYYASRKAIARGYRDEFTVRYARDNGAKVELAKILDGWGDYFLYGFAKRDNPYADPPRFVYWTLARLGVFRDWYRPGFGVPVRNPDGSEGRAFRWDALPSGFVVATRRPNPPPLLSTTTREAAPIRP